MKTFFKITGIVISAVILIVAVYLAYVAVSYHRLGSGPLKVNGEAAGRSKDTIDIISWNIGFGAYEADYDFFMDGGTQSWAPSKERLLANLDNISSLLSDIDADMYLIQETDLDGTRTYHVDETAIMAEALGNGRQYTFAQNYDSPFLMYPPYQPHGANKAGLMTFSIDPITKAERVELPIEDSFKKILDLDRCYGKHYVSMPDGNTLVLYNFHLSAYTTDGTVATDQLKILLKDMQSEYDKGLTCIAGGDFNKDLLGDSSIYHGVPEKNYTWAKPIPEGTFDGYNISLVSPLYSPDSNNPVPTARNPDSPYHKGQYVVNVDGFLVTDNVTVISQNVIDTGFAYSDHNPVCMTVKLSSHDH